MWSTFFVSVIDQDIKQSTVLLIFNKMDSGQIS